MAPKCYIGGCVLNNAKFIPHIMTNILNLVGDFEDYMLLFAYDDSSDNTLEVLNAYKRHKFGDKMEILVNPNPRSKNRSLNLCNARNWIHERIEELNETRNWEYFILLDCDEVCSTPMIKQNIMPFFDRNDWDCLTFNRQDYYDIWALAFDHYVIPCWAWKSASRHVIAKMMKTIMEKLGQMTDKTQLLECETAFNGFAIYRTEKFKGCKYAWKMPELTTYDTDSVQKCMVEFNTGLPHDILVDGERDDCEHRSFHKSAREMHGARICISPLYAFHDPPPRINPPWLAYYRGVL